VLEHHDEAAADATDAHELPTNDSAFSKPRRLTRIAWAGALGAHPLRSTRLDAPEHGWIGCRWRTVRVERIGECAHCVGRCVDRLALRW
jgi:hypothetical protein